MTSRTLHAPPDVAAIAARIPATPPGIPDHRDEIAAAVATIVERFHPERIVLFGSRARGTPRPDSDADLMVIADPPPTVGDLIDAVIRQRRRVRIGPQVRTPEQIRVGWAEGDFFILDLMTDGITLYGEDHMGLTNGTSGGCGAAAGSSGPTRATLDWVNKAEADFRGAVRLLAPPDPELDLACYLCQQCSEKYLKAVLQHHATRFPRTHKLLELATLARPDVPDLAPLEPDLAWLSNRAGLFRYPGSSATQADADLALRLATDVRTLIRSALGL